MFGSGKPIDFSTFAVVTCPAVIGRGQATADAHAIPAAVAEPIADALPNGRLQDFPGLSHFGPMEDGAGCAASMVALFGS